jgi:hypothetical protein
MTSRPYTLDCVTWMAHGMWPLLLLQPQVGVQQ